ncbi:MAG: DUF805 domain-containing protein, partial [Sutterella sp.]
YWASLFVSLILAALFLVLIGLVPNSLTGVQPAGFPSWLAQAVSAVILLYAAASAVYLTAAVVRRLHDIGYAGIAALFLIIPGVQLIVLVILGLVPGKKGLNRFGPDPLAVMTLGDAVPTSPAAPKTPRRPVLVVRETAESEVLPAQTAPEEKAAADARDRRTADAEDFRDLPPSEETAEGLFQAARFKMAGESLSIRLQVKARYTGKLRGLLKKGKISQSDYDLWARRLQELS